MSGRSGCPECAPFGVDGMVPVTLMAGNPANPYPNQDVETWRPCESCNPVRYAVWRTTGRSTRRMAEAHDADGYPKSWRQQRLQAPPLPRDRGGPHELPPFDERAAETLQELRALIVEVGTMPTSEAPRPSHYGQATPGAWVPEWAGAQWAAEHTDTDSDPGTTG